MLDETTIRRLARELGVRTDFAEKDYVNSWVLYGIYTTGFGDELRALQATHRRVESEDREQRQRAR